MAAGTGPVRTVDDLFEALEAARGGTLELQILRGADERTIQVTFGES